LTARALMSRCVTPSHPLDAIYAATFHARPTQRASS
jgi:hypothetical protein